MSMSTSMKSSEESKFYRLQEGTSLSMGHKDPLLSIDIRFLFSISRKFIHGVKEMPISVNAVNLHS